MKLAEFVCFYTQQSPCPIWENRMAGILDTVNQRTQLVGQNRLELLLFRLGGKQIYGINVFKVKEVLQCPKLTILPGSNPVVRGVAHIRTGTISIMDLSLATGNPPLKDLASAFVIITEYNQKTQGFLVAGVERIVNMNWGDIHPPPKGTGRDHYLTAVTEVDGKMVEIIDVEKILAEVSPITEEISSGVLTPEVQEKARSHKVLIVDDSKIARKQIVRCLEDVGVEVVALNDGLEAWNHLEAIVDKGEDIRTHYMMLISDIEMPEMDGYTLTSNIRSDNRLKDFFVVLHSSLSGVFNKAMVEKVGANDFIAKFDPDVLAQKVADRIEAIHQK
jgi:two-component system chemotaxis response regulator CheV